MASSNNNCMGINKCIVYSKVCWMLIGISAQEVKHGEMLQWNTLFAQICSVSPRGKITGLLSRKIIHLDIVFSVCKPRLRLCPGRYYRVSGRQVKS